MKKSLVSAATTLGLTSVMMLSASSAFAANDLTINGAVSDQTCEVKIDGNTTNPTILLPTVSTAELATAGSEAGEKTFSLGISGCTAQPNDVDIKTKFVSKTGASNKGNLVNSMPNGAENVQIQLKDSQGNPIDLTSTQLVDGLTLPANSESASADFTVGYISETGGATAGEVEAVLQYAVQYD
jgi:P pilus assembly protein, pilin FimA